MLQECLLKLYKSSLKCKAKGAAKIEQERKYVFSNYKTRFFSFFFTLTPPTSSVHNFLIFWVQIEWFKLLWNCHLKLYKSCSTLASELLLWSDYCEWQVSTTTNKKTNLTDVLHPDWSLRWALLSDNYLLLQGRWNNLLFIGEEPFPSVKRTGLCEIKIILTSISHSLFPVASSRPSVTGYSLGTLTPGLYLVAGILSLDT